MHLTGLLLFMAVEALATRNIRRTGQHHTKAPFHNSTAIKTEFVSNSQISEKVFYVTETRISTVTHFVTCIQAATSSGKNHLPSYSFIKNDGKTEWLGGKTPPPSMSYDIVTSYVTIQPSTSTVTITSKKGLTSPKEFGGQSLHTGVGKDGWNATSFTTSKKGTSERITSTKLNFASGEHATFSGTAYPKRFPFIRARRVLYPRVAGNEVIATIDGEAVSWTNHFHELTVRTVAISDQQSNSTLLQTTTTSTISSSSAASVTSSPVVLPIYPWDLNIPVGHNAGGSSVSPMTFSTPAVSISTTSSLSYSSSANPQTTLDVYPWDLNITAEAATENSGPAVANTSKYSTSISLSSTTSIQASPSPSITLEVYPWDLDFQPEASSKSTALSSQVLPPDPVSSSVTTSRKTTSPASCTSALPIYNVTFDDLPHLDVSSDPDDTDIPLILSSYRKLYWENHFGYTPPPSDPFPPKSPPQLAVYRASNASDAQGSRGDGEQLPGEVGAGPRSSDSAYWIDAHSVWLGCADGSDNPCEVTINALREGVNEVSVTQTFDVPPCPGLKGCALHLVQFLTGMTGLSGLQILANVDGTPLDYYLDNLVLSWSNKSCAAQQVRASSQ